MSSLIGSFCILLASSGALSAQSEEKTSTLDPMDSGWVASPGLSLLSVSGLDGQGRAQAVRLRQSGRLDRKPVQLLPHVLRLSVRVQGSGKRDRLYALLQDAYGRHQMVSFGLIDFKDVRRLSADTSTILQLVRLEKRGLTFYGFYIEKARGTESATVLDELEVTSAEPYFMPADPLGD